MLTPLVAHQLPKGLQVDKAVVLGKTETNQAKTQDSIERSKACSKDRK